MNISYKLNFGDKALAQWVVESQINPPRQIVLIPKEILEGEKLKPYFRRAKVVSHTETKSGFDVELAAVLMPMTNRREPLNGNLRTQLAG